MELLNVQSLFKEAIFKIPNYQRGYAWEDEQIADFLADLQDSVGQNEHYTGTITVVKKGDKKIFPQSFKLYDVVDGQQRLTTISIFIVCIHERLRILGLLEDDLKDIHKNVVFKDTPILELNDDSNAFYQNHIVKGKVTELPKKFGNKSEKNLANAKKQIAKFLDSYKSVEKVQVLYETLTAKFKVNFFSLSSDFEVGIVFETMNNRGLALSQIDKVKNYLIYLSSRLNDNELAEYINLQFGLVFKALMKAEDASSRLEDNFLRYSYIVYTGIYNEYDIHKEVKISLLPKGKATAGDIKAYVNFLVKTAAIFSKLSTLSFDNPKVNEQLYRLKYLRNIANISPFMIAFCLTFTEKDLANILPLLEIFSFRVYCIVGSRSDTGSSKFHRLSHNIYKNIASLEKIENDILNWTWEYGWDEKFETSLKSSYFYEEKESSEMRYLFYEFENYTNVQNLSTFGVTNFPEWVAKYDKIAQVEHIDPQTPQNREPSKYVHKLGNLTLTLNNGELENKEFANKKKIYEQSDLIIERVLSKLKVWNDDIILERTQEIIDFVKDRWAIQWKE